MGSNRLARINEPERIAAIEVAKLARTAGGRAFLVGGAVRDLISGTDAKDIDIEIFGIEPEALKCLLAEKFEIDLVGASFGVIKLHHLEIDISLPRRESKRGTGHKGFEISADPTLSVADAASRRDFTVNAIYYDPLDDAFEDPFHGIDDLKNGILRHVSEKFSEDPLRVLRGMQFVARFDLSPTPETIAICQAMTPEGLPPERLFEEWSKLLTKGIAISKGMRFLRDTGWVRYYPELVVLIGCKQDPEWHPEGDVWEHTLACLDAFVRRRTGDKHEDLVVGLAVLCHDLGKPATTKFERGHIRSIGHDEMGFEPTLSFLKRLTNEESILREVPPLVTCHMQPFALWKAHAGDAAVRRLAAKVNRLDRLIRVARADDEGRPPFPPGGSTGGADLKWLEETAERLSIKNEAPRPILQGRDLIAKGFKPSKDFGIWLKACFEAQLDGKFTDLEGAIAYFDKHFGGCGLGNSGGT